MTHTLGADCVHPSLLFLKEMKEKGQLAMNKEVVGSEPGAAGAWDPG